MKDIINYGFLFLILFKIVLNWVYIIIYKPKLEYSFGKKRIISFLLNSSLITENKTYMIVKSINSIVIIMYVFAFSSVIWVLSRLMF